MRSSQYALHRAATSRVTGACELVCAEKVGGKLLFHLRTAVVERGPYMPNPALLKIPYRQYRSGRSLRRLRDQHILANPDDQHAGKSHAVHALNIIRFPEPAST